MEKSKEVSKETLIERTKERGFFKKESISKIYARSNGSFYYTKPPMFADGHKTFTISREDVEGKSDNNEGDEVEYPFNMRETIKKISECENQEGIDMLIESGILLKDDARKGVIKALDKISK